MKKIKVLIAKPGLDGHDRGAKVLSRFLMDSGMEVIYTGIRKTPQAIVNVALQEDVDVIGLSSLSGGHLQLFKEVMDEIKTQNMDDVLVIGGGVIPDDDITRLKELGMKAVFTPGTNLEIIASFIKENVTDRKAS